MLCTTQGTLSGNVEQKNNKISQICVIQFAIVGVITTSYYYGLDWQENLAICIAPYIFLYEG